MANKNEHLFKGAFIGGAINAVINGTINWFQVKGQSSILLTDDSISSTTPTVFSEAVILAVSLAFMISSITYLRAKSESKPPYFPKVLKLALKHSVYAFGVITIIGILVQRFFGSVEVTPIGSAVVAGLIAGLVGGIVDFETKRAIN